MNTEQIDITANNFIARRTQKSNLAVCKFCGAAILKKYSISGLLNTEGKKFLTLLFMSSQTFF